MVIRGQGLSNQLIEFFPYSSLTLSQTSITHMSSDRIIMEMKGQSPPLLRTFLREALCCLWLCLGCPIAENVLHQSSVQSSRSKKNHSRGSHGTTSTKGINERDLSTYPSIHLSI